MLLGFIGLLLWRIGLGRRLFVFALLLLWLLSLPISAQLLMGGLERYPAITPAKASKAQAIVVLGSSRYLKAPEYGGRDSVSRRALFRLRYAAWLARRTGLPVIPSGGVSVIGGRSEAQISAEVLKDDFGVRVEQIEPRSRTTWENARYTAQLLQRLDLHQIILVTDAGHMTRAMYAFERNGVHPLPAPTGFVSVPRLKHRLDDFLPSAHALWLSHYALHEYLGLLWYSFK